jgi:hypothetical protein
VIAVRCTVCGGATRVKVDAVNQRCEFCGAEFLYQATHAASADVERAVRDRIEAIQPALDALDADALHRAAAGDHDGARQVVADHVRRVGAIYQDVGYYRLMGLETPEAIEQNLRFAFQLHLTRLGIAAPAPAPAPAPTAAVPGYARMVAALGVMDLDGALAGYTDMCRHQLDHDPRWASRGPDERAQMLASSIRTFALGLPWASPDALARHGIDLARVTRAADGTAAVTCIQCGAAVVLAHLVESVQCPYCSATFRVRLEGDDIHRARGHAMLSLEERVTAGRAKVPPGAARGPELTYVHAFAAGGLLSGEEATKLAAMLGLGRPTTCDACAADIALARGSRRCPLCDQPTTS